MKREILLFTAFLLALILGIGFARAQDVQDQQNPIIDWSRFTPISADGKSDTQCVRNLIANVLKRPGHVRYLRVSAGDVSPVPFSFSISPLYSYRAIAANHRTWSGDITVQFSKWNGRTLTCNLSTALVGQSAVFRLTSPQGRDVSIIVNKYYDQENALLGF